MIKLTDILNEAEINKCPAARTCDAWVVGGLIKDSM